MGYLVCFVSLVVALTSLLAHACPFESLYRSRRNYHCKPKKPYRIRGELERILAQVEGRIKPRDLYELLQGADSEEFIGDLRVGEILALRELSPDQCNLTEFKKRNYYTEINRESPANGFINHFDEKFVNMCSKETRTIAQEARAATDADRIVIEDVTNILKDRTHPTDLNVRQASIKYTKSLPGKKAFVQDARRLRILYACNNVQYIDFLVVKYARVPLNEELFADTELCSSYRANYKKAFKKSTGLKKRVVRKFQSLADSMPFGVYAFIAIMGFVVASPCLLTRAMLTRVFDLFKRARDPQDPKYTIHPINYRGREDGASVSGRSRRTRSRNNEQPSDQ